MFPTRIQPRRRFTQPRLAIYLLLLMGGLLQASCNRAQKPKTSIYITTRYEFAPAWIVEQTITRPLERELVPLGIDIYSESSDGKSVIRLSAEDMPDSTVLQVQRLISQVQLLLPNDASVPEIRLWNERNGYLRYLVKSDRLSPTELREWHEYTLAPVLRTQPGVAEVYTVGGGRQTLCIYPNLSTLNARGLAITDLAEALDEATLANPTLSSPEELLQVSVTAQNGKTYPLKELATVESKTVTGAQQVAVDGTENQVEGIVFFKDPLSAAEMEKQVNLSVKEHAPESVDIQPFFAGNEHEDENPLILKIQPALSLDAAKRIALTQSIRKTLSALPGVKSVISETGFSYTGFATEENPVTYFIRLNDSSQNEPLQTSIDEAMATYGVLYYFMHPSKPEWPATYRINILSHDRENAQEALAQLYQKLQQTDGISHLRSPDHLLPSPEYTIDREKAAAYGLSMDYVSQCLALATLGKTWQTATGKTILLALPEDNDKNPLSALVYANGHSVPLQQIISVNETAAPFRIAHRNLKQCTIIEFDVRDEDAYDALQKQLQNPGFISLPAGYSLEVEKAYP